MGKDNTTNFTQVGASYELGKGSISFDYSIGKTEVNTVANSLIKSVDNVTTESMKVGYDVSDKNKKWGASISLPSSIKSGNMHLNVPEARSID